MTYIYTGIPSTPPSNGTSSGAPAGSGGDGVNWPYNPNGQTPNFSINWNSVPPPTAQQIEQVYEKLINWLKSNVGSPAFYNGAIMLLQMTTDIGEHMGDYKGSDLGQFLSNQINVAGGETFLQMIIDVAAQATGIEQSSFQGGVDAAQKFLASLASVLQGLAGLGAPFNQMYEESVKDQSTINLWLFNHYQVYNSADPDSGSLSTWVDDNGDPMNFADFTQDAQLALGMALTGTADNPNTSVGQTIDAYYQTQIQQLIAEFKGNPWALLIALMNLINGRDEDRGTAINGYGGTLDQIKQANTIVQKMLGDMSGANPNVADFYKQLNLLQNMVEKNPALSAIFSQIQSEIGTINSTTTNIFPGGNGAPSWSNQWSVSPGVYHFPPGAKIRVSGNGGTQYITVPSNGIVYISSNSTVQIWGNVQYSFGQLAGMGDYQDIQKALSGFSSQAMSNFTSGVTGLQAVLNSMSPATQTQIQNETQTMQAMENFEKQAYQEVTNVNQQIMRLVQSVMG